MRPPTHSSGLTSEAHVFDVQVRDRYGTFARGEVRGLVGFRPRSYVFGRFRVRCCWTRLESSDLAFWSSARLVGLRLCPARLM